MAIAAFFLFCFSFCWCANVNDSKLILRETIASEKDGLVKNKFAASNVKSFSALLSKFVNRENSFSETKVNRKLTRFPLTMTLIIQGITGFKFGDTITSAMLPPKYKEEIINKGFQTDIIFTVTKVTQMIRGNSWTTTLDTVMRFAPGTKTIKLTKKEKTYGRSKHDDVHNE